MFCYILNIPVEIVNEILDFLDVCKLYDVLICCKKLKNICDRNFYFNFLKSNNKLLDCGDHYTMIIKNYTLYANGFNYYYQLGLPHNNVHKLVPKTKNPIKKSTKKPVPVEIIHIPKPYKVTNNEDVISVSCGECHTIILTTEGAYSFGSNTYGQLGTGHNMNFEPKINNHERRKIPLDNILSISCGKTHTLMITKQGIVSFGNNAYGQLGLGHRNTMFTPTYIPFFLQFFNQKQYPFCKVCCGDDHSIVIINDQLYGFGDNTDLQAGLKKSIQYSKIPILFNLNKKESLRSFSLEQSSDCLNKKEPLKYLDISCGASHTMILTSDGLYAFGRNAQGQLGIKSDKYYRHPTKVNFCQTILSVKCGSNFTTVLTTDGFYVFGDNYYGQLGTKDNKSRPLPEKVTFNSNITFNVKYMSCGDHHTIVYGRNNRNEKFYVFGNNRFHQLGLGLYKNKKYNKPQLLSLNI